MSISNFQYVRDITNRDVSDNIVTIKTSGSCSTDDNVWAFLGPLIALHASLQIGTNFLLYKVRGVTDRYQEQKYVALASLFVLEVLVIGVPVLVAVQDSPAARYIVMAAIVVLNGKSRFTTTVHKSAANEYLDSFFLDIHRPRYWYSVLCFCTENAIPKRRFARGCRCW